MMDALRAEANFLRRLGRPFKEDGCSTNSFFLFFFLEPSWLISSCLLVVPLPPRLVLFSSEQPFFSSTLGSVSQSTCHVEFHSVPQITADL